MEFYNKKKINFKCDEDKQLFKEARVPTYGHVLKELLPFMC